MGSTGGVAAAVRLLEAGVAALSDVDVEALSDGQQLALVRVVHPLVCRMEAQRSRVIGSVHQRGAVFADGAVSKGAWLRSRLRMSDGQAQVRAAAAARQVPELETIYAAGEVSYAQVSVVASVVPDIDPEVLAAGAGKLLAEQGLLDPDGGELLLTTLPALLPPPVPHDPRSPAHRRADALLDLCRLAANHTPTGWPATRRSSRRCSGAPGSRWTWVGRPGWSAPPNAAPSPCATKAAASPAATALHNGPTHTT